MRRRTALAAAGVFSAVLCAGGIWTLGLGIDRGPYADRKFIPIEQAYYRCSRCGSMIGGNFGLGPSRQFRSASASMCRHGWQKVTREEFRRAAAAEYGIEWSLDIPFWSRSGPDAQ